MAVIECKGCRTMVDASVNFCPRCGTPTRGAAVGGPAIPAASNLVSQVNFHREGGMLAWAVGMHIFIDNVKIGVLANDSRMSVNLPVGNHDLHVKGPFPGTLSGRTVILIQPGKIYQIEMNVSMNLPEYKVNFRVYEQ
jgi:hypothetical protein